MADLDYADTTAVAQRLLDQYGKKALPARMRLRTWHDRTGKALPHKALVYGAQADGRYDDEHLDDADARHLIAGHLERALGVYAEQHVWLFRAAGPRFGIYAADIIDQAQRPLHCGNGEDPFGARVALALALPEGVNLFGEDAT